MKKTKKIIIIVESCNMCKYCKKSFNKFYCKYSKMNNQELKDITIIHPECKLEDNV